MPTRAVWRPSEWTWPLLGVGALLGLRLLDPERVHGGRLLLPVLVLAAAVLAVRRLWSIHPAPTLCAAIALGVFSGQWGELGLGGLPLDRLLLAIVVLQFLLRAPGVAHAPRLRARNV